MIHRLKSGGRLKALVEPESGQIVKIVGKSAWAGQKALVIEKQHHMSFDGMENYLTYNVLVQGSLVWFQHFEIEIFEGSQHEQKEK